MSRKDPQFNLRLPQQLNEYIAAQALENRRSKTAEVVFRLEQSRIQDEQSKQAAA